MENNVAREPVFIPMNKGKIVAFFVLSLIFTIGSTWCLIAFGSDPEMIGITVFAVIIGALFLYCTILFLRRLLEKESGLWVTPEGIDFRAVGMSTGFVPWTDVERVFMTSVAGNDFGGDFASNYFIMLKVNHPETYLQQRNLFRRGVMKGYMKRYGTPIAFTTKMLDMDRAELLHLLQNTFRVSRGEEPQSNYRPF